MANVSCAWGVQVPHTIPATRRCEPMQAKGRVQNTLWQAAGFVPRPSTLQGATSTLQETATTTETTSTSTSTDSDLSSAISLDNIRQALIRQEDTIIFSLIERAQFACNDAVYQLDAIELPDPSPGSRRCTLLEYMLRDTEQIHGKVRRYTSPDEHAFYPEDLPKLVLPTISYPEVLAPCAKDININDAIMSGYLQHLLPGITEPGDDRNYGSAAMLDIIALQALSKRIHYGKFVAEAKFRAEQEKYTHLINSQDADALWESLTYRAVELKVVERVRRKAAIYGQDVDLDGSSNGGSVPSYKVSPDTVARLYDEWVMPLTKKVQVAYLLRRLD